MTQFTRRPPEGALSPILSRLPRGLFREEEGREGEKKGEKEEPRFVHRRGNGAANYSSFCCLIRGV